MKNIKFLIKRMIFFIKNFILFIHKGGVVYLNVGNVGASERFVNKRVLITGGGSGFGLEMARQFHAEGADVIIVGRTLEKLQKVVKDIGDNNIHAEELDIADYHQVEDKLSSIIKRYGNIDIFINNAGIAGKPNWDSIIDVNLKGTHFMMQAEIKHWLDNKIQGHMVNITSCGGKLCGDDPYRVSKWGIACMSEGLAKQYAAKGIVINCIAPGEAVTPINPHLNGVTPEDNQYDHQQPNRRYTRVEEVASLALYLSSDIANNILGQHFSCDGGWTINNGYYQ